MRPGFINSFQSACQPVDPFVQMNVLSEDA